MHDAQSVVGANNACMPNKRRRLDDAAAEEGAPSAAEGYDRPWEEDSRTASHAPGTAGRTFVSSGQQNGSAYGSSHVAADYAASQGMGATEGSGWQQNSESSAYPDLAPYQQQPYFYGQANQPGYNSSWAPTAPASQPYGHTATSGSYSVGEQAGTATMPYFPPQQPNVNGAETTDVPLDEPNSNYSRLPSLEVSNQYASYTQPSHTAALAQREAAKSSAYYFDDASMHLKIQSLPILDNLATQLIHTISKASFPQIQDLMRGAGESEDTQAYRTLKNLFDQTRKVYSRDTPFIDAIAIQMFQPNQQEIIRKANIATFIASILGAHDVSFFHLNEFFMETFVPLGHRLLKWQGAIYLDLKTQIYISALMNSDGSPEAMLDELFPADLDAQILTRHPDAPSLSPSEQDFIDRSRARKKYLLEEPSSQEAIHELPQKYQWNDFVREFATCITKNVDGIMNVPIRSQTASGGNSAARAAQDANGNGGAAGGVATLANGAKAGGSGAQAPESRKAAAAASTVRQPWTKPEEDALLAGLERVNGPHWSQILALYGRGGSVSEVLKDRNQVQLKDKARNLKLWYLKTGKEVPPALRGVTGELRKRGGARARAALGLMDEEEQSAGADGDDDEADKATSKRSKKKTSKK
ncbi:Transcription factor TBF1 [Lecanosticta acicola]|uniref:Transcription factor TBF1 n=1 Tax=Lecanosticta acicola TaxID=111012 RepID=A0AAI8Z9C4_9PEZI|nr:Transcription factor TBF1 [Lecanosticta acicola]